MRGRSRVPGTDVGHEYHAKVFFKDTGPVIRVPPKAKLPLLLYIAIKEDQAVVPAVDKVALGKDGGKIENIT